METTDMLTQFGMMNSLSNLKTGHWIIDLLLCVLVPVMLVRLQPIALKLSEFFANRRRDGIRVSRRIDYKRGCYGYNSSQNSNNVLHEAILLYIGSLKHLTQKYTSADVELKYTEARRQSDSDSPRSEDGYSSDEDDYDPAKELNNYKANTVPQNEVEITIGNGLYLRRAEVSQGDNAYDKVVTSTIEISCGFPDTTIASEKIDNFIQDAFSYYKKTKSLVYQPKRHMYMPLHYQNSEEGFFMMYRRYELSDEKTFDSLFHTEKEHLLRLVDDFLNKKGKFALAGYPHKLGLLLYGPPGTGKTSFIKALAHHSQRSIVCVPLSKIKTNQELMDIMFEQKCRVQGEEMQVRLPFKKCIFVMEDIDAATDIVQRRSAPPPKPATSIRSTSLSSEEAVVIEKGGWQDGTMGATIPIHDNTKTAASSNSKAAAEQQKNSKVVGMLGPSKNPWDADDALNLAGVLNVLDGVVDCPQRIVVMTSNHPEKLDPALIRPGRINKKLELGYMVQQTAAQMIQHYFQHEATPELMEQFCEAFPVGGGITPAALESKCAECESLQSLIDSFKEASSAH